MKDKDLKTGVIWDLKGFKGCKFLDSGNLLVPRQLKDAELRESRHKDEKTTSSQPRSASPSLLIT